MCLTIAFIDLLIKYYFVAYNRQGLSFLLLMLTLSIFTFTSATCIVYAGVGVNIKYEKENKPKTKKQQQKVHTSFVHFLCFFIFAPSNFQLTLIDPEMIHCPK